MVDRSGYENGSLGSDKKIRFSSQMTRTRGWILSTHLSGYFIGDVLLFVCLLFSYFVTFLKLLLKFLEMVGSWAGLLFSRGFWETKWCLL